MSASNAGTGARESTQRRLKTRPTSSAMLWGHLLASNDVSKTASHSDRHETRSSAALSTIAPVDKTGTSLRILLHDTQANLEKFSERVGKLTGDIDESKREIGTVKTLLQQDHEKTVEEIVDLVNRCQLEVQRSVGAPAQAEKVDDIRTDLANVVTRLTALENKMDMLQMLNQTQLQALQTVQDQQGKLIAAISPVLPLLQGIAPHLENLRRDVSDGFRDLKSTHGTSERRNAATAVVDAPSAQSLRDTPPSRSTPEHPSDSARRKKRKLDAENNTRGTPNGVSLRNGTNHKHPDSVAKTLMTTASSPPPLHSMLAASSASPEVPLRLGYAHQMRTPYRTPRRPPLVDLLNPNATSGPSRSTLLFTAQGGVSTQSGNAELLSASVHAPRTPGGTLRSDGNTATLTVPKPPTLVPGTPKNADSLASTTSTLSQSSIVRHDSVRAVAGGPSMSSEQLKTVAIKSPSSATVPSLALVTPARQGNFTPSGSAHLLRTVALNGSGTPVVNRPLSLKDIRALTATPAFRQEGKRFIPLDDDDDDDLVE